MIQQSNFTQSLRHIKTTKFIHTIAPEWAKSWSLDEMCNFTPPYLFLHSLNTTDTCNRIYTQYSSYKVDMVNAALTKFVSLQPFDFLCMHLLLVEWSYEIQSRISCRHSAATCFLFHVHSSQWRLVSIWCLFSKLLSSALSIWPQVVIVGLLIKLGDSCGVLQINAIFLNTYVFDFFWTRNTLEKLNDTLAFQMTATYF